MTISSTTRKAGPYTGNGVQTVFAFAFKVFVAADVLLTKAVSGVESALTLTTDYTVALNADQDASPGGSVTLLAPLANGALLTITSQVDSLQTVLVTNAGGFFPTVVNTVFDKLTILVQQLIEKMGRALVIPITQTGVTSLNVPVVPSGVLQWKADGTQLLAATLPDLSLSLALPNMAGKANYVLSNNGAAASWTNALDTLAFNGNAAGSLRINAAAGTYRFTRYATASVGRWDVGVDSSAESGGNAGSDFFFNAFTDAGGGGGSALIIRRSSLQAEFYGNVLLGTGKQLQFNGRGRIDPAADGVLTLYNSGATDFGRLQFGGTNNTCPSLKRNAAGLDFKLADDSAFCAVAALSFFFGPSGRSLSDVALAADVQTGSSTTKALTPGGVYSGLTEAALTYSGSNIVTSGATLDNTAFNDASITLTQNSTIPNLTNPVVGRRGRIRITQDAGTPRTVSFGANWHASGGLTPSITATLGAVAFLDYDVVSSTYTRYALTNMG